MYMCIDFRLSETASGAFSGTFVLHINLAIHCRLAISKGASATPTPK